MTSRLLNVTQIKDKRTFFLLLVVKLNFIGFINYDKKNISADFYNDFTEILDAFSYFNKNK